jgi:CelD/BcsL family acetyltransferase involved in cellulose biosynthesis
MATTEPGEGQARADEGAVVASSRAVDLADRRRRRLTSVADEPVQVRAFTRAEELEALRGAWGELAHDGVQTDPDYFMWSLHEARVVRPHVLAVTRGSETVAIAVARVMNAPLRCKLGYATVYTPVVRTISVVHDGVLGRVDPVVASAVVSELLASLDRGEADALLFRQLEVDSVVHHALRAGSTFVTRQHAPHPDLRWQIDLPETMEEYHGSLSSNMRKSIRQTARRVEGEFGDRLTIRTFREVTDLDEFFADAEHVARRSYQRRIGVGFQGGRAARDRSAMLTRRGWFRGYVLYVDGAPVAFEQGEVYRGRFHSLSAGYDPAYARFRVGAYLQLESIADLVSDPCVTLYDFGFGDADYKHRLGHRSIVEADAIVYARRPRPLWVNLARSALLGASTLTNTALDRVALKDRIERLWVDRLSRA